MKRIYLYSSILILQLISLNKTLAFSFGGRELGQICTGSVIESTRRREDTCVISLLDDLNEIPETSTTLNLYFHPLHTIDFIRFKLPHLSNLTGLRMDVTYIEQTLSEGTFEDLPQLERLSLTHGFSDSAGRKITLQSGLFRGLYRLSTLSLPDLGIISLPPGIFNKLPGLQHLDLHQNSLADFSPISGCCSNLLNLNLAKNLLREIKPGTFSSLRSLSSLDLHGNEIGILAVEALQGLERIVDINLSENGLESIEVGAFVHLNQLRNLHLDGNKLSNLPSSVFQGLEALNHLDISRNQLTKLEAETFSYLPSLIRLLLESNMITVVDRKAFSGLTNLEVLVLSSNAISPIESETFSSLQNLKSLKLQSNKLQDLRGLQGLPNSLIELDISQNSFSCSCDLHDFLKLSSGSNFDSVSSIRAAVSSNNKSGGGSIDRKPTNRNTSRPIISSFIGSTRRNSTRIASIRGSEQRSIYPDLNSFSCFIHTPEDKAPTLVPSLLISYHALHCLTTSSTPDIITTRYRDVTASTHTTALTNDIDSGYGDVTTDFSDVTGAINDVSGSSSSNRSDAEVVPTDYTGAPTVMGPLDLTLLQKILICGALATVIVMIVLVIILVVRHKLNNSGVWWRRSFRASLPSKHPLPLTFRRSHSTLHDRCDHNPSGEPWTHPCIRGMEEASITADLLGKEQQQHEEDKCTISAATSSYDVSTRSSSLQRDVTARLAETSKYDIDTGTITSLLCDVETVVSSKRIRQSDVKATSYTPLMQRASTTTARPTVILVKEQISL